MALSPMLFSVAFALADPLASNAANDVQKQYERWERRLRVRVTELHVVPVAAKKDPACEVVISFAVGHSQRPSDTAIRTSTCQPFHDRAARRLVRSLGRVGRVPSVTGKDHRVILKLTYGIAPTAAADRSLTDALTADRQAYSRRNLEIVTMATNQSAATLPSGER